MTSDSIFRWLFLGVLLLNLAVSAYHRTRARDEETIPRTAESLGLRLVRVAIALPGLVAMLAYLINPDWMRWSQLPLPQTARWAGVAAGLLTVPFMVWVFRSLGKNVSETVLTKEHHELVTHGPYRWIRHPLYTGGILWLLSLSLIAANGLMAALAAASVPLFAWVIVPREEAELCAKFGDRYRRYQRTSGKLLPRLRRGSG